MTDDRGFDPLLAGVRVVDMADQKLEMVGRYLADLGADVVRVEPPGGAPTRTRQPLSKDVSLYFAVRNQNKRGLMADLSTEQGRALLHRLVLRADIFIESLAPGGLQSLGLSPDSLLEEHSSLVILSITDFGQDGPYRDYVATDAVQLALGTQLSRSGRPDREPLMLPRGMAHETSAMQAVWSTLLAYYQALETGVGDHIDFSTFEGAVSVLDPPIGMAARAIAAQGGESTTADTLTPGHRRPGADSFPAFPIFPCRDGHVRLAVLSARQWRDMRAWLGEPDRFQDAKFEATLERTKARDELEALYEALFKDMTMEELADEGQRRGIPIASVMTPAEVLAEPHFADRGTFVEGDIAPGIVARMPSGFIEVDGRRVGYRQRAPQLGEHNDEILRELEGTVGAVPSRAKPAASRRPLQGLRVIDFGVITFGAEAGRLFADMGAEVIKIENRAFPDLARQNSGPSQSANTGHRNKKSFAVDLRKPEGVELLKRLATISDVVLSNFKPGTLDNLGLGYDTLAEANPGIVWLSGSAVGHTGRWSSRLGYGPLVRCSSGLTSLWRYPDDLLSFGDPTTLYPDHYSARVGASAVLAALIRRKRTGVGADIRISQAEAAINMFADLFVSEALSPGSATATGGISEEGAPWNVYPCAGDDEWCVITVRDDSDWARFVDAVGAPWASDSRLAFAKDRIAMRATLDSLVSKWTRQFTPTHVMTVLQRAGVPAGTMVRFEDFVDIPQIAARDFVFWLDQPGFDAPLPTENEAFRSLRIPPPPHEPSPLFGEHTRSVAMNILGIEADEIERLVADGVLEV